MARRWREVPEQVAAPDDADDFRELLGGAIDTACAPALRAFLAEPIDGRFGDQKALARAVIMARRIC